MRNLFCCLGSNAVKNISFGSNIAIIVVLKLIISHNPYLGYL